ncbi:MAG: hypothetical protein IMZ69_00235, partial [Spirochaetes bacterium]|nr:hypothetical protein [Spirochaetota bacterium]
PEDQQSIENLKKNNVLVSYRQSSINYWWFERPVPDVMYYQDESRADVDKDVIWGDSTFINGQWATMCDRIATVYANVCEEGFSGIVYDNEAYYSYVGKGKPWLWEGHPGELGPNGNYYKRGLQIGKAIGSVWPRAKVMMVYAMGYPGEYWWYKGFQDAGVDLYLAIEHTYGAGPEKLGDQWYQHWWRAGQLTGVVDEKRTLFDFIPDDRHIVSGVFPIDFGAGKQNYDVRYFAEQLRQVSTLRGAGPFGVWIWPQGSFTPDSWKVVRYPQGTTFDSYWGVMRSYSLQDQ